MNVNNVYLLKNVLQLFCLNYYNKLNDNSGITSPFIYMIDYFTIKADGKPKRNLSF